MRCSRRGVIRIPLYVALFCALTALVLTPAGGPVRSAALSALSARAQHAPSAAGQIRLIERQTSLIRGLQPLLPVPVRFRPPHQFYALIAGTFRHDDPQDEIRKSDIESILLGLIPPAANLRRILSQGLTSQVVGYYDQQAKALYVLDTGHALGTDRWTIAHEFTHALQDQHFNLNRVEPDQLHWRYRNSDAGLAEQSVVEGDATSVQITYVRRYYTYGQVQALLREQGSATSTHVPRAIEEQFTFPYTTGLQFVQALIRSGGYAAVDAELRHPPTSTHTVMFPGSHFTAHPVAIHRLAGTFSGWTIVDDDVMGAFGYKQLVEQQVAPEKSRRLALLWRGDRYVLLQHHGQYAMRLESRYDDPAAAAGAARILAGANAHRFSSPVRQMHGVSFTGAGRMWVAWQTTASTVSLAYAHSPAVARALCLATIA